MTKDLITVIYLILLGGLVLLLNTIAKLLNKAVKVLLKHGDRIADHFNK